MATYETTSSDLDSSLTSSNSVALTQDVITAILNAVGATASVNTVTSAGGTVTVPAGTEVGFFHFDDSHIDTVTIENPPAIMVLQTSAGVEVLVNTGTSTDAHYVIVGSSGNDNITVSGTGSATISLGTGNSTVNAGQGNDTIVGGHGSATIDGGGGDDVLVLTGTGPHWVANTASVVAGTSGLGPQASTTDHVLLTNTDTGATIDLTGVQYVALDNNDAIIVAASTVEAGVASLYHAAFGRTGEAGGVEFWFDYAKEGLSLHDIAVGFTQSPEFAASAALSNHDFITQLYTNTFGRAPDAGGMTYWTQQLANGASRADLLTQFATVAALNEQGVIHTEVTVVGTVLIVDHIV